MMKLKLFLPNYKGVIGSSVSEPSKVEFPFFAGRKQNLKFRVIFNLKSLSHFVAYHKFKMVTVESSLKLMSKGYYMASINLRDAYY